MRSHPAAGVHVFLASLLFSLAACSPSTPTIPPPSSPAARPSPTVAATPGLNPVALAGLTNTVRIDVLEFSAAPGPGGQPDYVQRLALTDPKTVADIVSTLDANLKPLPKARCVPEFELRFQLAGGATQKLGYSCQGASFLRGDQPAWRDVDAQPPAAFDRLMQGLLAAPAPRP
jgi:hypothetical protein